jgi:prephenate dehydrogenase
MDVGSTKRDVVAAARAALGSDVAAFVPAHPIAGKERAGVDAADADLYRDRHVILTPLEETDPDRTRRARALWEAMGAVVSDMSPEDHDRAFAAVSHLPHLLAFAYVASVARQPEGERMLRLAGPGFRDFTRIAGGEPAMWRDILLANRDEVLAQAASFRHVLGEIERAMLASDAQGLMDQIAQPSALRSGWEMGAAMGALAGGAASRPAAGDEAA